MDKALPIMLRQLRLPAFAQHYEAFNAKPDKIIDVSQANSAIDSTDRQKCTFSQQQRSMLMQD